MTEVATLITPFVGATTSAILILAVIILMFAGTIGSAQSTGISLGIEQSNSQVRANGSKYSGVLSGLKLSGRMELAGRYYAHVDYTTGSGKVTASDTKDVSYTE